MFSVVRRRPREYRVLAGYGNSVEVGVHADNIRNLQRAVAERVLYTVSATGGLVPTRQPKPKIFQSLNYIRNKVLDHVPRIVPVSREQYPELYRDHRRKIYERAAKSLATNPVSADDAKIRAFIKAEKVNFSAKDDPAPRIIQPRAPRYILEVGRYLKPYEKKFLDGFRKAYGYPVVVKGMNAVQTAGVIASHWAQYSSPMAVGLDASRFDQHVSKDALEWEHSWYNAKGDENLARLLRWQLVNKVTGLARDGLVKYTVEGRRMSGDINTSLGNCILMSSIVLAYLDKHQIKAHLVNNGDDCVLIMERHDYARLACIDDWFSDYGFKLTREEPVYQMEQIEFCQCHPVQVGQEWRMVRNPRTAMSKDAVSIKGWRNQAEFDSWRNAISTCGKSLTDGVPVWYRYYDNMWAPRPGRLDRCGMEYLARGLEDRKSEVLESTRVSFYRAFGIMPDAQVAIEQSLPRVAWESALPTMTSLSIAERRVSQLL